MKRFLCNLIVDISRSMRFWSMPGLCKQSMHTRTRGQLLARAQEARARTCMGVPVMMMRTRALNLFRAL